MDLYTRIMWMLIRKKLHALPPVRDGSSVAVPSEATRDVPVEALAPLLPLLGATPIHYSLDTSDDKTAGPLTKALLRGFVALLHRLAPIRDTTDAWASTADADRMFAEEFAQYLPAAVHWEDPTGDDALIHLATQGLGAHRLTHLAGDTYALDLSFLRQLPVRPGFEPYGARLRLGLDDRRWRILGIDIGDRVCTAADDDWWLSKLLVRSSLNAVVTIVDHALDSHVVTSGAHLIAANRSLPADHPVRRLLAPFSYNTGTVDLAAVDLLLRERRIFQRVFAFTWEAQNQLYAHGLAEYRTETFPEELARRGVAGLGDAYPYGQDGLLLWDALDRQLSSYVGLYYPTDAAVAADPGLAAWCRDLATLLPNGLSPVVSRSDLTRLCLSIVWNASARHKQFGTVAPYLAPVSFIPGHVRKGTTLEQRLPSPGHRRLGLVLAAFTSPAYPKIDGDFSRMALDQRGQSFWKEWARTMAEVHTTIEARNAQRARPLHTFDPAHLECSVSI
jgi:hypothetical protein